MEVCRWFHANLTGADADALLKERGVDGSYLARPSHSNPGDFTLSVRRKNEVTHIKIQNCGDFYDLYGGDKFATLSELVQYYTSESDASQLRERNGELILLKYPLNCADPTSERWFHGQMSGREAEECLMMGKAKHGSFLVRLSQSKPGEYVMSVRVEERVSHVMIRCQDGKYDFGGGAQFESLRELVEYYRTNPMVEQGGAVVLLVTPFNATRITARDISVRFRELSENTGAGKMGFWEEFEFLQQSEHNQGLTRTVGALPENRAKNRFKNITPYDHTRVILEGRDPGVPGSDYINANHIRIDLEHPAAATSSPDMYSSLLLLPHAPHTPTAPSPAPSPRPAHCLHYIATQGCLSSTMVDFWEMVWQQRVDVVVMVTRLVERGKNKCVQYWPSEGSAVYGDVEVTAAGQCQGRYYVLRELALANTKEQLSRTIYHYQFTAWPDHGLPSDPSFVLDLLHDVNRRLEDVANGTGSSPGAAPPGRGPMLVHCSAGIGRTGTFIALDVVLKQIERHGLDCELDIQRTIQQVRTCRSGMVQTEAQYKLVYAAVRDYVETSLSRSHAQKKSQSLGREYTNIKYFH